jgi:serine/threonine protein kinase
MGLGPLTEATGRATRASFVYFRLGRRTVFMSAVRSKFELIQSPPTCRPDRPARSAAVSQSSDPGMTRTSGDAPDPRDALNRPGAETRANAVDETDVDALARGAPPVLPGLIQRDGSTPAIPGYAVVRKLSSGGQGTVYEAIQISTQRRVALKVIRDGPLAHPANRRRLERGVRVLGQLRHPHIVGVIDTGVWDGSLYYVMDFVAGVSLDEYMQRHRSTSFDPNQSGHAGSTSLVRRSRADSRAERQSIRRMLTVFARICEALDAAHLRGVIHRDIKPANVFVDASGEPYLLDFDLAKILDDEFLPDAEFGQMTVSGEFLGSLRWASPEQVLRKPADIDLRTDVYSLGVVLYEILTGQFPYPVVGTRREIEDHILHAEPVKPRSIRRAIDDELETIVLKCLSKEPARRYRNAGDLASDVQNHLSGDPISAKRDSSWYMVRKLAERHRAATIVAVSVVAILLSSLVYVFFAWRVAEHEIQRRKAEEQKLSTATADLESSAVSAARAILAARTAQFRLFLAERAIGDADRARWAAAEIPQATVAEPVTPESLAAQLLLGDIDESAFTRAMPENAALLRAFALGEFHLGRKRLEEARRQFVKCETLSGPQWLRDEAAARLLRLTGAQDAELTSPDEEQP